MNGSCGYLLFLSASSILSQLALAGLGAIAAVNVLQNSRRLAVSRSRKGDQADGRVFNDPYAQASATMYGKISRAAFHVAQHSALQRPGSREQAPEADDLWESPGAARRGSASSSLTGTAYKAEQVALCRSLAV